MRAGLSIFIFVEVLELGMLIVVLAGTYGDGFFYSMFNGILLVLQILATVASAAVYVYQTYFK